MVFQERRKFSAVLMVDKPDTHTEDRETQIGPFTAFQGRTANVVECDLQNSTLQAAVLSPSRVLRIKILEENKYRSDILGIASIPIGSAFPPEVKSFPIIAHAGSRSKGHLWLRICKAEKAEQATKDNIFSEVGDTATLGEELSADNLMQDVWIHSKRKAKTFLDHLRFFCTNKDFD